MKRRAPRQPAGAAAMVVHDVALLVVAFYSPILWGAFNAGGQAFASILIGLAALAALAARWSQGRGPALIPNPIHLPALLFLAISGLSALLVSVSHHASAIELARIAVGVLLFYLVANRALLPAAPAGPVAAAFAWSVLVVLFVRVPGESSVTLASLSDPAAWDELIHGAGAALRLFAVIGVAAVTGLVLADRKRPDPIRWWTSALLISAAFAVATYGLREKLLTLRMLKNQSWSIFSTFFNPNSLAGFLAMCVFLAAAAALANRALWRRLLWAGAALLLLAAVVPTHSKGAVLAVLAGAVVFVALTAGATARRRRNLWILAGLSLAVLLMGGLVMWRLPAQRTRVVEALDPRSASNMFRLLAWQGTARMAADHPLLGIGPGGFKYAFMNYAVGGYTEAAHENYLQIGAEQGFAGLAVFLWMIAAALFTARRGLARARDFGRRALIIGAVSSLTALLVHSLLDYDWYIGAIGVTFWLVVGVIAHQAHGREVELAQPPQPEAARGRRRGSRQTSPAKPEAAENAHLLPWPRAAIGRGAASAGVTLLLFLCLWPALSNALAQTALDSGNRAAGAAMQAYNLRDTVAMGGYLYRALNAYRTATEYDPGWSAAWERYGLMLGNVGQPQEAAQALLKAVKLEPTSFQPRLSLASFYYDQKQYRKAADAYQQSLARYPANTRALRRLGITYQQLGENDAALTIYHHMVQIEDSPYNRYRALSDIDVDTEYAYAHYQLGRAALKDYTAGRRPDALPVAIHEFQAALAVIASYQQRGKQIDEMFRQVGQPREDRAGELAALEARARWRLGAAYQIAGDRESAVREREQALKLYPEVAQAALAEDGGKAG